MSSPLGTGDRFGPYLILRLLGRGMSTVHEAVRSSDGTRVALKILRQSAVGDSATLRERFAREVLALRTVSHPSIPELIDAGDADGMPYLCTRFIEGTTLAASIERWQESRLAGPLGGIEGVTSGLCVLFAGVADALHVLHGAGFVHRDVKPDNILVDEDGRAWLLDLGLVRTEHDSLQRLTRTGHVVGTPGLLAPEQIDPARGRIGPWTDVHGLAATFFTCLTLRPPFTAASPAALFDKILHSSAPDPRELVPELPQHVAALLRRALAGDPEERHRSADGFAEDLRRVGAGRPPSQKPLRPLVAMRRGMRGLRRGIAGFAALAALALVVPGDSRWPNAPTSGATDVVRLAAEIDSIVTRAADLGPPWPENVPELVGWIADANAVIARRGEFVSALALADPGERELIESGMRTLAQLVDVEMPDARNRLAWARSIAGDPLAGDPNAWADAAARVATDPRFGGFTLHTQAALVPLGIDPFSGLCEFHDLASAGSGVASPRRDHSGHLVLEPEHGIVLVLVPPAESGKPPFLAGKHEVTRFQWMRLANGSDPSFYPIGAAFKYGQPGPTHPVDRVRWSEAIRHFGRWGLALPSKSQWQHLAAAEGRATVPTDPTELSRHVNILDRTFALTGTMTDVPGWNDGFVWTAPVGSLGANAFGLHDTFGNLWEWTAETSRGPTGTRAVARGGAFDTRLFDCRPDYRFLSATDQQHDNVGLRAVRELR